MSTRDRQTMFLFLDLLLPGSGVLGKSLHLLKPISHLQMSTIVLKSFMVRTEEYNTGQTLSIVPGTQ